MYMIVVGAGGVGTALVEAALRNRHNVVVIERDPRKAEDILRRYDVKVFNADAAAVDMLRDAGAARADALVATTHDDATNLMVIAAAGDLGIPSIVSVVGNPKHVELFKRLGAHVVENPDVIVAEYLYNAVRRQKIQDLVTLSRGAQVFRATVTERSRLCGKSLREAGGEGLIPEGVLIVLIERGEETIIPSGMTAIQPGDLVTVFSKGHVTDALIEQLTG
jgi:trk system potassium uptake protein TrkA